MQPSVSGQPTLAAKVADAIDRNYLDADGESWKRLKPALLENANTTVPTIDRELAALHDADLRTATSSQIAMLQDESAGKEHGIGLVDFAIAVEPKTDEPKVVTALVDSPAFTVGLLPGDLIVTVNGRATRGLMHEDVMAMLRGDSGTLKLVLGSVASGVSSLLQFPCYT